jgi:16S rRNA (uracil1498-N3)-methyltransferase
MHRFFLPPARCQGIQLTLDGPEAHHALHVVRVQAGDRVGVLDGAGTELACEVSNVGRREVALAVVARTQHPPAPFRLTLAQAVTKARSLEWIIQKATELGCHHLVPVITGRSVPHYEAEAGDRKAARWLELAIEALKQCGGHWLPGIPAPAPLAEVLARPQGADLALVAALRPDAAHPREILEAFAARTGAPPRDVTVWVGPEGDFTEAELAAILGSGARPINLGPRVLRSETAAVYCLSFLNYELQQRPLSPRA